MFSEQIREYVENGTPLDPDAISHKGLDTQLCQDVIIQFLDASAPPAMDGTAYLTFLRIIANEFERINAERRRNAIQAGIDPDSVEYISTSFMKEKEKIYETAENVRGLCPFTGGFTIPIVWKADIDVQKVKKQLAWYGNTKGLSLPLTITNIIDDSAKKGCSRKQQAEMMLCFCKSNLPGLTAAVTELFSAGKYRDCVIKVIKRIDIREETEKIREAMLAIVRTPKDNIVAVTTDLEQVCRQTQQIFNSKADQQELDRAIDDYVIHNVRHFVTPETANLLEQSIEKNYGAIAITKDIIIEQIQSIESRGGHFKITSDKRIPKNNVALSDINPKSMREVNAIDMRRSRNSSRDRRSFSRDRRSFSRGRDRRSSGSRYPRRSRSNSFPPPRSGRASRSSSFSSNRTPPASSYGSRSNTPQRVNAITPNRAPTPNRDDRPSNDRPRDDKPRDKQNERGRSPNPRQPMVNKNGETMNCYRCNSSRHLAAQCFRFASSANRPCHICERKLGIKLYHDPFQCNHSRSAYRSPSANTRQERKREMDYRNRSNYKRQGNGNAR